MACRDSLCGGCSHCLPWFFGDTSPEIDQEEFTENARQTLVAAANDLVKRSSVTQREMEALEKLLDVFDPQEGVQEDAGVAF